MSQSRTSELCLSLILSHPNPKKVVRWRNGYSVGLAINRSQIQILLWATLRNNLGQVVHTYVHASVTNQYDLVPAKERRCSAAGKVTAGLAESNGSPPPGG